MSDLVYQSPSGNERITVNGDGVYLREVFIKCDAERTVRIAHISDVHINYCDEYDLKEADPVLMSTLKNRKWLKDAAALAPLENCLAAASGADAYVFNGDVLDYLSHGALELADKYIFKRFPDCIATVGGHEISRRMQGELPETTTREERLEALKKHWRNDIFYTSKVIADKIMLIGFLNDCGIQTAEQCEKLRADLLLARQKGYCVLLFAHEPIATHDPRHKPVKKEDLLTVGDPNAFPCDLCEGANGALPGGSGCDETARRFYELIYNGADVIKGFFAGHKHSDLTLRILAKTPDGRAAVIPQYVNTACAYGNGHLMIINIGREKL